MNKINISRYALIGSVLVCISACTESTNPLPELTPVAEPEFVLVEATIKEIQEAFDEGSLTSVTLIEAYLDRIARYDKNGPAINSIISINPRALERAAALDLERQQTGPRSALHGIPVLLKDNIDTHDLPTTNGSAILRGIYPPDDAPITRELRAAGAIILGKASMGEFASGSYNSVIGQATNPYNFRRDTGGSSSGSASAIAANFAVLAVGTDTSTSVRGPSAYNGIVGLRPTTGLISRNGIAPKDLEFDSAGPMARTVTDVAHMLSVIAVYDPEDPLSRKVWSQLELRQKITDGHIDYTSYLDESALNGVRVGVVRDFFGGDPEIDVMANEALEQMRTLGAELVDVTLDEEFKSLYLEEGSQYIRRTADYRFREDWEAYLATLFGAPKTVAEFIEIYETEVNQSVMPARDSVMRLLRDSLSHSTEEAEYQSLVSEYLPRATADKLALFEKFEVDVLVFPYASAFASVISNPAYEIYDPNYVESDVPAPATLAGYNSVGFPCIVVPMGIGTQGLPMAIAFFGRPYEEGQIIAYAYAYEQASLKRRPPPLLP